MTSLLGASYERVSCLAARLSVTQDELLERFDENHRKAVETERVAKALAMEVVGLLSESLRGRITAGEKESRCAVEPLSRCASR